MNTTHTLLRKSVALLTVLAIVLMAFAVFFAKSVNAAAITNMGIEDNDDFVSNSIELDATTTEPTVIQFTTDADLDADGDYLEFVLTGFTASALAVGDLSLTCDIDGDDDVIVLEAAPGTGDNGAAEVTIVTGDDPVITIVLDEDSGPPSPHCGAGDAELTIATGELVASGGAADAAGNYPIFINTTYDSGAFLVYIGDENDVHIEADVDNVLTFVIRNAADTADQANVGGGSEGPNLCDLGNLTTAGVQSCAYRLKVSTNATSGYYVTVTLDGDLDDGLTNFINNTATGSQPSSGTEGYNILFAAGASSVGGVTVTPCDGTTPTGDCTAHGIDFSDATGTVFGADAEAAYLTGVVMYDVDGPNSPDATDLTNTALVTHRAESDAGTPAGTYTQLATYTVTARW